MELQPVFHPLINFVNSTMAKLAIVLKFFNMKNITSFTFVFYFVLPFFSLEAQQPTFEYILRSNSDKTLYFSDLIETSTNDILFCGGISKIWENDSTTALIVKVNEYGNYVDSLLSKNNAKASFCQSLINYSDDTLLTMSSILGDSSGNDGFIITKLNIDLEGIDTKIYNFPSNYKFVHATASLESSGKVLVGGAVTTESTKWRPFLYSLDSQFDSIVAKFYLDKLGTIFKTKLLSDNKYWIIIPGYDDYELLDSSLAFIDSEQVPDYLRGNIGVKWDTDTSFYLVGGKLFPEPRHNLGFIRQYHPFETEGHLFNEWGVSDTFDFPAYVNGIDFKCKDTIFIGGSRNLNIYNPYYAHQPSWFIILQTDSMLNIRWERFYGGDAYYVMGKIIASNDGGCIIGGTRYDYLYVNEDKKDIIVLKLNEYGLLVGEQETPSIEMHEAIVYPNPGTTEIKVRIAAQYQKSLFQLFDMNGKQVASKNIIGKWGAINTSFLKPGTYVYRISSEDGLFESGKWVKK